MVFGKLITVQALLCSSVRLERDRLSEEALHPAANGVVEHDHHDEVEWSQLASKVKHEFDKAALTLCIKTPEEMKELIDDEMKFNETKSRQSFSGVQVAIDQLM